MTTDIRRLMTAMESRDENAIYDVLAEAHGWPRRGPSRCVACAPHGEHEQGRCSGAAAHALDRCRCDYGAVPTEAMA